jgi:hypothetical protein
MAPDMIKPFDIMRTREEPDGTGVFYSVTKRRIEGGNTITSRLEGYLLIPRNENVEAGTYARLKQGGLVE